MKRPSTSSRAIATRPRMSNAPRGAGLRVEAADHRFAEIFAKHGECPDLEDVRGASGLPAQRAGRDVDRQEVLLGARGPHEEAQVAIAPPDLTLRVEPGEIAQ